MHSPLGVVEELLDRCITKHKVTCTDLGVCFPKELEVASQKCKEQDCGSDSQLLLLLGLCARDPTGRCAAVLIEYSGTGPTGRASKFMDALPEYFHGFIQSTDLPADPNHPEERATNVMTPHMTMSPSLFALRLRLLYISRVGFRKGANPPGADLRLIYTAF